MSRVSWHNLETQSPIPVIISVKFCRIMFKSKLPLIATRAINCRWNGRKTNVKHAFPRNRKKTLSTRIVSRIIATQFPSFSLSCNGWLFKLLSQWNSVAPRSVIYELSNSSFWLITANLFLLIFVSYPAFCQTPRSRVMLGKVNIPLLRVILNDGAYCGRVYLYINLNWKQLQ